MEHFFNCDFAKKHGVDEAILHNYYFTCKNSLNSEPTIPEIILHFPYWDKAHIFHLLSRLSDLNLL